MSLSHKVITISEHTYQLLKDHIFYIDSISDNEKIILQSSSDAKKTKAFIYFYMLNELANEGNLFNFIQHMEQREKEENLSNDLFSYIDDLDDKYEFESYQEYKYDIPLCLEDWLACVDLEGEWVVRTVNEFTIKGEKAYTLVESRYW